MARKGPGQRLVRRAQSPARRVKGEVAMSSAKQRRHRQAAVHEFLWFGIRQLQACVFAGAFFLLLAVSRLLPEMPIARYDLILIGAVLLQFAMIATRLESRQELVVVCLFHLLGLALEIFKTQPSVASWAYPEPGVAKLFGVPLYSGFMYAAVASYMMQAWHRLDLALHREPPAALTVALALAIYLNFFMHHFLPDVRWLLAAALLWTYRHTSVSFTPKRARLRMPLLASFVLIGLFVWIAENVATYFGAWTYPHQAQGWRLVHWGKIGSWGLLVVMSFVLVADLRRKAKAVVPLLRTQCTADYAVKWRPRHDSNVRPRP
jgi:uncharacterized membrane protein YoaT (DUF817 family)